VVKSLQCSICSLLVTSHLMSIMQLCVNCLTYCIIKLCFLNLAFFHFFNICLPAVRRASARQAALSYLVEKKCIEASWYRTTTQTARSFCFKVNRHIWESMILLFCLIASVQVVLLCTTPTSGD
jgi:hypothetical protein